MEVKQKFNVEVVDGKIVTTQTVIKELNVGEAMLDQQNLHQQMQQQEQQTKQLEKQIEADEFKSNLAKLVKQKNDLLKFNQQYLEAINPISKEFKEKLRQTVSTEKAKRGYSRLDAKNDNGKIMMQNQILAPLALEHKLEMNHPLIMELKRDFETL